MVESVNHTRHRRRYYSCDYSIVWLFSSLLFQSTPAASWIIITPTTTLLRHKNVGIDLQIYGIPSHQSSFEECKETTTPMMYPNVVVTQPNRRRLLHLGSATILSTLTSMQVVQRPCFAGEIGRRITEVVTTSELGISVRRSVVRGAQIMDAFDLRAEKFSDTYQLGSERSKQTKRPKPKHIPPLQPFDTITAFHILQQIDNVFCSITNIPLSTLQQRVQLVMNKVQPSFERSGVLLLSSSFDDDTSISATNENDRMIPHTTSKKLITIENGPQFNFLMYVHYKSYTELWLEKFITTKNNNNNNNNNNDNMSKKDFAPFQKQFEKQIGKDLLSLFLEPQQPPASSSSSSSSSSGTSSSNTETRTADQKAQNDQERAFYDALKRIDDVSKVLVAKGFVAQIDRTQFDDTDATLAMDVTDWSQQLISDLSWSIALDNDITLSSQILLQEQGIRFYPNYIRCIIQAILQQALEIPYQQKIVTEDYYLDTDYNSDPDKFEVKEVLININIENTL